MRSTLEAQAKMGGVGGGGALTPEALDGLINVPDIYSQKIMKIVAKHNALEDCMAAVKKGLEKDAVPMSEFLQEIRNMSVK